MNADTGDGHMILQRRLPAGRHAPRHAFAPHLTAKFASKRNCAKRPPNVRGRVQSYRIWEGPQRPIETTPPEHPLDAQTLMLRRPEANSRFFTDCYLYPAALRSRPWPNEPVPRSVAADAVPILLLNGRTGRWVRTESLAN